MTPVVNHHTTAHTSMSNSLSPRIVDPRHRYHLRGRTTPQLNRYTVARPVRRDGGSASRDDISSDDEDSTASELLELKQKLEALLSAS